MSLLLERKFTFTWEIQNFSMCPLIFGERIVSPVFFVKRIENSEWQIRLYPKGKATENGLACYLCCKSVASNEDGCTIDYNIEIIGATKENIVFISHSRTFKNNESYGYKSITAFSDKEAYLPNDTLTIKCSMWQRDSNDQEKNSYSVQPENATLSRSTTFDHTYESGQLDECYVVTCIEVQKRNVSWYITNFSAIPFNKKLIICVPSALQDEPSFFLTFYKSATDQTAEIEIRCTKTGYSKRTFVKCKISVPYTPKGIDIFEEDEHLFDWDTNNIWKFQSFMKIDRLEKDANLERMNDSLHLRFEFSFATFGCLHHREKVFSLQYGSLVNIPNPIKEFKNLYKDAEQSDVTIRVGDREFKVHKIILKARSSVFKAMFDHDMKEKKTGVIDIIDMDPDTVDRMLVFMYSNTIESIQLKDALKLYSAADKYDVQTLKIQCVCVLDSSLSVSNVCEVLTLADRYNDGYLHDSAANFVLRNSVEVLKSAEWQLWKRNNAASAAKIMHNCTF